MLLLSKCIHFRISDRFICSLGLNGTVKAPDHRISYCLNMSVNFSELFRSTEEQEQPLVTQIEGEIPRWLEGNFIRLGPGKFDLEKASMKHWLDGFAVVYKFEIKSSQVYFLKKFVKSCAYKKAISAGQPVCTEYATQAFPDPNKNALSQFIASLKPDSTDNAHINLFELENTLFVGSETNFFLQIDIDTLETGEKIDLNKLTGINLSSSHLLKDEDGNSYTIGTSVITGGKYQIIKFPHSKSGNPEEAFQKVSTLATINPGWTSHISYYHSFGMSKNYIVFIEQPFIFNMIRLLSLHVKRRCLRDCLDWNPAQLNRFYIIEKSTGKILPLKYKSVKPFFLFHHINTYEEDNQLVIDIIAHNDIDVLDNHYLETLRQSKFDIKQPAGGCRFILPLPEGKKELASGKNLVTLSKTATAERANNVIWVTPEVLAEPGYELPTINKSYFGRKYRYFYATGMYDPGNFKNSIVKVDTWTGKIISWKENEYTYPGEAQFIQRPDSNAEDDGILLSAVTDIRPNCKDFLLILDANTMTEIARAKVNAHVPALIHGLFIPTKTATNFKQ